MDNYSGVDLAESKGEQYIQFYKELLDLLLVVSFYIPTSNIWEF